jgi:hypothetical protein
MPTKKELLEENELLREKLEAIRADIDEMLDGYVLDLDNDGSDQDGEDQ